MIVRMILLGGITQTLVIEVLVVVVGGVEVSVEWILLIWHLLFQLWYWCVIKHSIMEEWTRSVVLNLLTQRHRFRIIHGNHRSTHKKV